MEKLAKQILMFCLLGLLHNQLIAQDTILLTSGEEIESKVLEVGVELIKYKKFSNIEGPTYSIEKDQVFIIWYENGEKDIFENSNEVSGIDEDNIGTENLEMTSSGRDWSKDFQIIDSMRIALPTKIRPLGSSTLVTMEDLLSKGDYSIIYYGTIGDCFFCTTFLDTYSNIDQSLLDENNINVILMGIYGFYTNRRKLKRINSRIEQHNWPENLFSPIYIDDDKEFAFQNGVKTYPIIYFVDKEGNTFFKIESWYAGETIELLENKIKEVIGL